MRGREGRGERRKGGRREGGRRGRERERDSNSKTVFYKD